MLCINIFSIPYGIAHHSKTIDTSFDCYVRRQINLFHYQGKYLSKKLHQNVTVLSKSINSSNHISFQIPLDKFFMILLLCCDIMCLNFLFLVKNTGSWLEIGTSISHFVIMECTVVVLCLLQIIAKILTTYQFQSLFNYGRTRDLSTETVKIE